MKKHIILMLLCCLVPVIIAGILFYFGFKTYALIAVMLLCPVMHYFLMKDMHNNCENNNLKNMTKKEVRQNNSFKDKMIKNNRG